MKFKIYFITGYNVTDVLNDNIDINVILENGKIYFGTLFTIKNIEMLMRKDQTSHFWATNMVVIKDLEKMTIKTALGELIESDSFLSVLAEIGTINDKYFNPKKSFDEIEDMSGLSW